MQPHLKKCFGGIDSLEFNKDLLITAMVSVEGERVPLKAPVDPIKARGAVEKWLLQVRQPSWLRGGHVNISGGKEDESMAFKGLAVEKWLLQVRQPSWLRGGHIRGGRGYGSSRPGGQWRRGCCRCASHRGSGGGMFV